jgi:hypothetical protein
MYISIPRAFAASRMITTIFSSSALTSALPGGEAETLEQTAHLVLDISQSAGLRFKSRRMPLAALDELFHQESEVGP